MALHRAGITADDLERNECDEANRHWGSDCLAATSRSIRSSKNSDDGETTANGNREPLTKFGQGVLEPVGQGLLDGSFAGAVGQTQEVEDVRVLDDLLGLVRVHRVELMVGVAGGGADSAVEAVATWCSSTGRVHLLCTSRSAYQSRNAGALTWSSRVHTWPQGSFPTLGWETGPSGQARGERPEPRLFYLLHVYCTNWRGAPVTVDDVSRTTTPS